MLRYRQGKLAVEGRKEGQRRKREGETNSTVKTNIRHIEKSDNDVELSPRRGNDAASWTAATN